MNKISVSLLVLIALTLTPLAQANSGPEKTFRLATTIACAEKNLQCQLLQVSREKLAPDLVYYRALIKVGPGDYDVIAVNRLIRERNGVPVRTDGSFFFIPGSSGDFNSVLLTAMGDSGLGVFLGKHNIDVWGIDLRNVQIPADATDLPNAHDWGYDLQISDVRLATRISRYVRVLTAQGVGRIILAGHSSGAALTYAVANAEALLPRAYRDVGGLIPIDMIYKLPPSATEQSQLSCDIVGLYRYYNDAGLFFFDNLATIAMAKLAQTDPNGISPYGPPLTNLQYALETAGGLWFWPIYPIHPWAVVRNDAGIAVDGRFTQVSDMLGNFVISPAYPIPNAMGADVFSTSCATMDTPYDDNLAKIRVPVLYVGAAGGFGALGKYTTQLVGSKDVQTIMIQLLPDADTQNDFGHMEVFTANHAPELVWEPMRRWIANHRSH
jgi:pimeloyl-ACP methyl ester carboxylesterase